MKPNLFMIAKKNDVFKNRRDKKEIAIEQYKGLSPTSVRTEIMYGLAKVHKIVADGLPPFRPILSAIGTPTYKLVKVIVPMLVPLATNGCAIRNPSYFLKNFKVLILNL